MARKWLGRRAAQERADTIEDAAGEVAREVFRLQCAALGRDPEVAEAILRGRDAEYALVKTRAIVEPHIRAAVDRALAIGRRS